MKGWYPVWKENTSKKNNIEHRCKKRKIAIWNRKEVAITRDLQMLTKVCGKLQNAGIAYRTTTNSMITAGRHHAIPNIRTDSAYQYRIYVHRKDYTKANRVL